MIHAIDRRLAAVFSAVLGLLCRVTGRDNFFFAEGAAICSGITACVTAVLFIKGNQAFIIFLVLIVFGAGMICTSLIEASKKRLKDHPEQFPLAAIEVFMVQLLRLVFLFLAICFAVVPGVLLMRALIVMVYLTMATAYYFLMDVRPKTKGRIKRAVEWFQTHRLRLPRHIPSPVPG